MSQTQRPLIELLPLVPATLVVTPLRAPLALQQSCNKALLQLNRALKALLPLVPATLVVTPLIAPLIAPLIVLMEPLIVVMEPLIRLRPQH